MRLMTELRTSLPLLMFLQDEKKKSKIQRETLTFALLDLSICYIFSMCPMLTPSVLARYFDRSLLVSLECAEMVTDKR